jgi:hypothetical protein
MSWGFDDAALIWVSCGNFLAVDFRPRICNEEIIDLGPLLLMGTGRPAWRSSAPLALTLVA